MTSRFDGRCSNCRAHILKGEAMKWVSKGVVECMDCASLPTPQENMRGISPLAGIPVTVDSVANQWADAMSWEEEAPAPGSSINIDKPADIPAHKPGVVIKPSEPVNIMSLVDKHPLSAKTAFNTPLPTRGPDISKPSNQALKPKPLPVIQEILANPVGDPMTALLSDQLVTLVNAIDSTTTEQRDALKVFAEMIGRGSDSASRARIWEAVAALVVA